MTTDDMICIRCGNNGAQQVGELRLCKYCALTVMRTGIVDEHFKPAKPMPPMPADAPVPQVKQRRIKPKAEVADVRVLPPQPSDMDILDSPTAPPDWVKRRQQGAANAVPYVPVKPEKAKPLDLDQIHNALLPYYGPVVSCLEGPGDTWFVTTVDPSRMCRWYISLYEYKGDWLCAELRKEYVDDFTQEKDKHK